MRNKSFEETIQYTKIKNLLFILCKIKFSCFIFDSLGIKDKNTIKIYENYTSLLDDNIIDLYTNKKKLK